MGCDIHMYIEYKVDDGEWIAHESHVETEEEGIRPISATGRNYYLFGLLAGVRSIDSGNNLKPRGLPLDVTSVIKKAHEHWGVDAHSVSFLFMEEFKDVIRKYNKTKREHRIPLNPKRTDMFFDYNHGFIQFPPSFSTIISGAKKHKADIQADFILLGAKPPNVEYRLIFWFDN